jgi:Na+/proline symporter/nitrogen-specific signal transduction histidine kinase
MPFNLLVLACVLYVAMLFAVAFLAERSAAQGAARWLRSPWIYTLSLSIYCTAWTFYGAVGYAARSGLEFLTIYLGPTLIFVGWWWLLRKLVRIGRKHQITSIADMISARFGKSNMLGAMVTVIAVMAATPYIALQLQSVTQSFGVFASETPQELGLSTAAWVAMGLALFTILFGTRKLDAREQHPGVVMAIAVEAVVKLVALLAVGVFVVWGLAGGVAPMLEQINASPMATWELQPGRWAGLILTAAMAVICLPRMFHVIVVENTHEAQLGPASWAFPAYLFAMSLFIVPIAVVGMDLMPTGANPDMFVLTLPLAQGQGALAMLAFLGGFSSATSMVIVETIALATMVSNHIVVPVWLRVIPARVQSGDVRRLVLLSRRLAIMAVLALGYGYYRLSGGGASLAAMGLIAFVGVAQFMPALLGGIFWRGATRSGAAAGLLVGAGVWLWALFLPSFGAGAVIPDTVMANGPFGIGWLRPEALFGITGLDPLVHALFWSLALNTLGFCVVSILTFPGPVERMQGAIFVNIFDDEVVGPQAWVQGQADAEALLVLAQRILGEEDALALFEAEARRQGRDGYLPDPTPEVIARIERDLAGVIGAAAAHAMIADLTGRATVTVEDLMAMANETAAIIENQSRLEAQQAELTRTARALRDANEKLLQLSAQKDAFLSQISHELRTPMTSIRAFSEILTEGEVPVAMVHQSGRVIQDEAVRLTRLLDDLLDLSVLENGSVQLEVRTRRIAEMLDQAIAVSGQTQGAMALEIERDLPTEQIFVQTDTDRLVQVFINLVSNARKYCDAEAPKLKISVRQKAGRVQIDFVDNGKGIPKEAQSLIFEKFARLSDQSRAGGAGLGLAICREVMTNLRGTVSYLPGQGGAAFRVVLPLRLVVEAA